MSLLWETLTEDATIVGRFVGTQKKKQAVRLVGRLLMAYPEHVYRVF